MNDDALNGSVGDACLSLVHVSAHAEFTEVLEKNMVVIYLRQKQRERERRPR